MIDVPTFAKYLGEPWIEIYSLISFGMPAHLDKSKARWIIPYEKAIRWLTMNKYFSFKLLLIR